MMWKVILVGVNHFNMCSSIIFLLVRLGNLSRKQKILSFNCRKYIWRCNDSVEKHHKGLGIFYLCFGVFVLTMIFWK